MKTNRHTALRVSSITANLLWLVLLWAVRLPSVADTQPVPVASQAASSPAATQLTNPPALYTRTFKVDTNEFARALGLAGPVGTDTNTTNVIAGIREFFSSLGVEYPAPGKAVFYGGRLGTLTVRATLADLDIIERALSVQTTSPPRVDIQAKFIEVGPKAIGFEWFSRTNRMYWSRPGSAGESHSPADGELSLTTNLQTKVLTPAQARVLFRALEGREGVEILSPPTIATLNGRQAQIRPLSTGLEQMSEQEITAVGNRTMATVNKPTSTSGATTNVTQTAKMPEDQTLDVISYVAADGYTIRMTLILRMTEFLDCENPSGPSGAVLPLPPPWVPRGNASVVVRDGQTIVIAGLTSGIVTRQPDGSTTKIPDSAPLKKQLFIFITPTIVDPSGNRVHKQEETIRDWPDVPSWLPKEWQEK